MVKRPPRVDSEAPADSPQQSFSSRTEGVGENQKLLDSEASLPCFDSLYRREVPPQRRRERALGQARSLPGIQQYRADRVTLVLCLFGDAPGHPWHVARPSVMTTK
jgi:hypothetical protein